MVKTIKGENNCGLMIIVRKETALRGRQAEWKTAKILYEEHGIVTFPSPDPCYDLITEEGLRIEIKYTEGKQWNFTESQVAGFCDFLALWKGKNAFIVPGYLVKNRYIKACDAEGWANRWDLMTSEV